ncbi:MAG: hypothetical protein LC127_04515 [Chitinophagales bacterium]|nr:hypothetical protein [Chitinophagales bacterium]
MNIEFKITLWAVACAYALANSFIYSWTFWTAFDVNILQFASFTDILPSIIYTLTVPFIVVISSMIATDIWTKLNNKIESMLDDVFGKYIKNYKRVRFYSAMLAAFLFMIGIGIVAFSLIKSSPERPPSAPLPIKEIIKLVIPFVITLAAIIFITTKTSFLETIKYRNLLIFCICLLPVTSYVWAISNSKDILMGKDTFLVKSDTQCKSSDNTDYRYISSISDKAFSLSLKDGSICIFKYNHLELIPEKKGHFTQALDSRKL